MRQLGDEARVRSLQLSFVPVVAIYLVGLGYVELALMEGDAVRGI